MLETIREYALERLAESGELEDARNRHLERYVELAETAEPELTRAGQAVWLERLDEENDNIRAALAWSFESGQVELGLRLAGALVRFWSIRGLMTEGRRWLTEALAASTGVARPCSRRRTSPPGFAALGQGDYPQAKPFFERSLDARARGRRRAPRGAGAPADRLARDDARRVRGGPRRARRASSPGRRSSSRARSATSSCSRARSTSSPSSRPRRATRRPRTSSTSRASALRRELGDKRLIANSVLTLGRAELTRGDYEHATALLQEGFALARELGDTWSMSLALTNLGRVALLSGGDAAEAAKLFADALELAKERGDKRVAAECLQGLGAVVGDRGRRARRRRACSARARRCSRRSARRRRRSRSRSSEQFVPPVKATLGDERFAAEWAAGSRRGAGRGDRARAPAASPPGSSPRRLALSRAASRLGGHGGDGEALADAALVHRAPQHAAAAAPGPRARRGGRRADHRRALLHGRDHVAARDRRLLGRRARVHDRALLGPPLAPPGRGAADRGRAAPRRRSGSSRSRSGASSRRSGASARSSSSSSG